MKHIHFIAIGGAIMHQLAIALLGQGYKVTGSDDEINDPAKTNLAAKGLLPVTNGWFPEKLKGVDAVVLGMHARLNNPELVEAQKLGIPVYSFPEYVYEVSKNKKRVVIAGSHGKTTITSMVMHILKYAGLEFDYLVGARVDGFELSVKLSDAPIIVLEGDEYPASPVEKKPKIFFYHPHISVLNGIAWDHINVFPTYENYFSQFEQYLAGLSADCKVLFNNEDSEVVRAINAVKDRLACAPYTTPDFHYEGTTPMLHTASGSVAVSVFGRHNLLNMQAAIDVCRELGVAESICYEAIASFKGAARRLEKVKEDKDLLVYRDFAHAPSKLRATLDAVREAYPEHELIACFELHTFSSLNEAFQAEYAHCMDAADNAMVFFSHHALDLKGLPNLERNNVKSAFRREDLTVIDDKTALWDTVDTLVKEQTKPVFLLLMSSGTFDGIDWNQIKK